MLLDDENSFENNDYMSAGNDMTLSALILSVGTNGCGQEGSAGGDTGFPFFSAVSCLLVLGACCSC